MNTPEKEKLKEICDVLKQSHSSEKLKRTLEYVRQHCKRHPLDLRLFISSGGIQPVIQLLLHENSDRVQSTSTVPIHAVYLLSVLAIDDMAKVQLSTVFSIDRLVEFMGSTDDEAARSRACSIIANLFVFPPTGTASVESSSNAVNSQSKRPSLRQLYETVATAVVKSLDTACSVPKTVEGTMRSLCLLTSPHFISKIPYLKKALIKLGVIRKVAAHLSGQQEGSLIQWIIMAMTNLVRDPSSPEIAMDVSRQIKQAITLLVQLTSHETPGVQQSSLDLLTLVSQINVLRSEMGSKGVIACFLEHLAFDEEQTTISSMQNKITVALTYCCLDGYNRAKLKELSGLSTLVGILGSSLYSSVHLPVLSCLPEFRHDKSTLMLLIELGAIPLVIGFLDSACSVLGARSEKKILPDLVVEIDKQLTVQKDRKFSLSSPSYQNELEISRCRTFIQSPTFSPVSDEEFQQTYQSPPASPSPVYMTSNSPEWCQKEKGVEFQNGRYSPVIDPDTRLDTTTGGTSNNKRSNRNEEMLIKTYKYSIVWFIVDAMTSLRIATDLDDHEGSESLFTKSAKRLKSSEMSTENAKRCMMYALAFLEPISFHGDLSKLLASKTTLDVLAHCLQVQASRPTVEQILLRLVRDRLCFEQIVKNGFVLTLQDLRSVDAKDKESRVELLRHLRMVAEEDFGFGELLHLCIRSTRPSRMVCIASAVILLQTRSDRNRLFERHAILDYVFDTLTNHSDGLESEEWKMIVHAVHSFFVTDGDHEENPVEQDLTSSLMSEDDLCQYKLSLPGVSDQVLCTFDVDTEPLLLNRSLIRNTSEVFSAMLSENFREGRSCKLHIGQTSRISFEAVTHYICGCRFTRCRFLQECAKNASVLIDIYQLADQYLEFDLRDDSMKMLVETCIHPDCIADIFDEVLQRKLDDIGSSIVDWLVKTDDLTTDARAENLSVLLGAQNRSLAVSQLRALVYSCL